MRKQYVRLEVEVIEFTTEDVIITSPGYTGGEQHLDGFAPPNETTNNDDGIKG